MPPGPIISLRQGLEHVDYFKSIPWCAEIINDPRYTTSPTVTRSEKSSGEDSFMARTLQTEETIVRMTTINPKPDPSLELPVDQVFVFFELGNGVNGYPGVCHGGFVATMLDEALGVVLNVIQLYENTKTGQDDNINFMTAYLNISYHAPVPAPGIILATAKVVKQEGRKMWVNGTLEDEHRTVLAKSEGLFIQAKNNPRASVKL